MRTTCFYNLQKTRIILVLSFYLEQWLLIDMFQIMIRFFATLKVTENFDAIDSKAQYFVNEILSFEKYIKIYSSCTGSFFT